MVSLLADEPIVLMTALDGVPGAKRLLDGRDPEASSWLEMDRPERRDGWLIEPFGRSPELLIVGGTHVAVALSVMAPMLGFHVTVIEPRSAFGSATRFPGAAQVIRRWPDEALKACSLDRAAYVVVLSHDPKFEDPAILTALAGSPQYLGVIGSRATHQNRVNRLLAAGLSREAVGRIRGPIGLDLGARTAEETALAILAEMIAVRYGHRGGALSQPAAAPATAPA